MAEVNTADGADTGSAPTWLKGIVTGFFGLFYAYAVWNALGNLILALQTAAQFQLSLNGLGWAVWLLAVIAPIAIFAGALGIMWRKRLGTFALVLLLGLSVVAMIWLNVIAFTTLNTSSMLS